MKFLERSSYIVGDRGAATAHVFVKDTAARLANRVQLTTDGHKPYREAVEGAFGSEIDYAQLIKIYGADSYGDHRYSPAACIGTETTVIRKTPVRRTSRLAVSSGKT